MKTRILSALIMLPLLLALYAGGIVLKAIVFAAAVLSLKEFYKAFKTADARPSFVIGIISCILLYGINIFSLSSKYYLLWLFILILMSLLYLFKFNTVEINDVSLTIVGVLYIVFFSYHMVLIDGISHFSHFIWLVLITAFITDSAAYFTGYFLGKHKLCPKISPKKTIEGSVGGTIGSVIFSGLFGYFFAPGYVVHCLLIGLIASIAGQLGDLTASIFKRKIGIKDYGTLIPGHGGMLDRVDSVLFTAPVVYYYIMFVIIK